MDAVVEQGLTVALPDGRTLDVTWTVDLAAASPAARWGRGARELLAQEVAEMAAFFPRWVLTSGQDDGLRHCPACADLLVFREGHCRCVRCGRRAMPGQLAWIGHLPIPVDGLPRAAARIAAHPHPAFPLVPVGGAHLWLVPLIGFYPPSWPRHPPTIRYDPALFTILGLGTPGAHMHVVDGTACCLYGANQWRAVTFRVVLQQRVVNHLASLLKIADGQAIARAFVGRPE